jgi:hypothetical protein
MSDDFFAKIDSELNKQKAQKDASDTPAAQNQAFFKSILPRITAIADSYAAKCKERGIFATVSANDRVISFTLRYKSGEQRELVAYPDPTANNRMTFEEHYPSEKGKRYKSLPSEWYDESNWSDDIFSAKIEKTIQDFVYYADRQGGI